MIDNATVCILYLIIIECIKRSNSALKQSDLMLFNHDYSVFIKFP